MESEWLNLIFGIVILIPIVIGCYFITRRNRQKQKVVDLILISKVYSVSRITSLAGVSQDRAIRIIKETISQANTGGLGSDRQWRVLRGAQLDFDAMQIILSEADERTAMEKTFDTAKKAMLSKFTQNLPEEPKEPWICPYCDTKNPGDVFNCGGCKASQ